jgi:RNA polymerase sigma-70 factor (ECF subfamily)
VQPGLIFLPAEHGAGNGSSQVFVGATPTKGNPAVATPPFFGADTAPDNSPATTPPFRASPAGEGPPAPPEQSEGGRIFIASPWASRAPTESGPRAETPGVVGLAGIAPTSIGGARHEPVVTPSVASFAGNGQVLASPADGLFRISRAPAGTAELEVHFTLNAYSGEEFLSQEGAAVIDAQATQVELAAAPGTNQVGTPEVAVLTLQDGPGYHIGRRAATVFAAGAAEACSEAALLGAYRHGQSDEAFATLVDRYRASVFRTSYRLLGNSHDAEDVMQFVFLALAQRGLHLRGTLGNWLRTVARHAAIMVLRARGRRGRHEQRAARADLFVDDQDGQDWPEELAMALSAVPAALQEAVRLRYLEGHSQHEAAAMLGVPRGTLAQRAARGILCLRDVLTERGTVVGPRTSRSATTEIA